MADGADVLEKGIQINGSAGFRRLRWKSSSEGEALLFLAVGYFVGLGGGWLGLGLCVAGFL